MRAAIVRAPPDTFARALRLREPREPIDLERARTQHRAYVGTIARYVPWIGMLPPADALPDSCFVEDTAVVIGDVALVARLGAPSRRGEEVEVRKSLRSRGLRIVEMEEPATLDGGDVLDVAGHGGAGGTGGAQGRTGTAKGAADADWPLFVGVGRRTNDAGADALARAFPHRRVVPIPVGDALHLESAATVIAEGMVVLVAPRGRAESAIAEALLGHGVRCVPVEDPASANVLRLPSVRREDGSVGDVILVSAGRGATGSVAAIAEATGATIVPLDLGEFEKVDGGATCLSILVP